MKNVYQSSATEAWKNIVKVQELENLRNGKVRKKFSRELRRKERLSNALNMINKEQYESKSRMKEIMKAKGRRKWCNGAYH